MKSLLRLKPYLIHFRGLIIGSALLAIPLALLRLGPAPLVKFAVDDLLINKTPRALYLFPILIIGMYLANFFVRFFHYYLMKIALTRINQMIKNQLFRHLMGLSADYFTQQSTGTLISRIGTDPMYLEQGIASINSMIREPITFVFLLIYALKLNWKLTLVTFLIFPPLVWVFAASGRLLKKYIGKLTEENARLYSTIQESFTGVRVIKTFRLEKYVDKKFREKSNRFANMQIKISALEEVTHPLVELLISFLVALIVYFGGTQVLAGQMSGGDLMAFFTAFALMVAPIRTLNEINIKLNQSAAACERVFEIFDWKSRVTESPSPQRIRSLDKGIEIQNITFAYPDAPQRSVLSGISFSVPKGKVVALVGASGAGKSSLVSLIPRIYDVTGGSIQLDGKDIRDLSLHDLRRLIAVVSQEVFLFNDTIEENIRCGRLSATPEEIREAARKAHALDFIESSPQGFKSVIGDRGQKLSGGERQRISIARAFLREAPILILDEATSSLDTTSERAVQGALEELMQNRTTLIIAHRLTTIQNADEILVMKDGTIMERGSHAELLKKNGEYTRFYGGQPSQ